MVSKRNEKPLLADWEVSLCDGSGNPADRRTIPQSRWKRSKRGWYTFGDDKGIIAEFTPGTVLHIRRLAAKESTADAEPAPLRRKAGKGEDA
jgi:hypothetical protein